MEEINEYYGYWYFITSIDWKEPWLILLILTHLLTSISIFSITRSHTNIQIIIFFILLGTAYFSENINELAARHWRSFSKQQYFDSNGLFLSIVFSIPLLINCMLLISIWLYDSAELIFKLKDAQKLRKLRRAEAEKLYKLD